MGRLRQQTEERSASDRYEVWGIDPVTGLSGTSPPGRFRGRIRRFEYFRSEYL